MGNGANKMAIDSGLVALENLAKAKNILESETSLTTEERTNFVNIAKHSLSIVNAKIQLGQMTEIELASEYATYFACKSPCQEVSLTTISVLVLSQTGITNSEVFKNQTVQQHLSQSLQEETSTLYNQEDVVRGIARVVTADDQASVHLANSEVLKSISNVAIKTESEEKTSADEALLALSLTSDNDETLKKNEEEMKKLEAESQTQENEEDTSKALVPKRTWKDISKRAVVVARAAGFTGSQVVISYHDNDSKIAHEIKTQLQNRGLRIWLSVEDREGDIMQCTANAVGQATAVIILVSRKYIQDIYCKYTAQAAARNNLKIIPVKVEAGYNATGWLGLIIHGLVQFKFFYPDAVKIDSKFMKSL